MQKILICLFMLIVTICLNAQTVTTSTMQLTVTVDSTETVKVYHTFPGSGGGYYVISETAPNPKDVVYFTGDLLIEILPDSAVAVSETDSLLCYWVPLAYDGKLRVDTLYCNMSTHLPGTKAASWLDWNPHSYYSDTNAVHYWVDLTGNIEPCYGGVFHIRQQSDDNAGFSSSVPVRISYVR